MRSILFAYALMFAGLGGCLDQNQEVAPSIDVVPAFGGIQLNSCSASIAQQSFWGADAPGTAPPGWEYSLGDSGRLETKVEIQAIHCNRVSTMGLERPAQLVFEYHSNFNPPEKCMEGDWSEFVVLHQAISDDAEFVARWANASIPAKSATMSYNLSDSTMVPTQNWAWTVSEGFASELTTFTPNPTVTRSPQTLRLAWWADEKLHVLDLKTEQTSPQVPIYAVLGDFSSDMLISAPGTRSGPIQGGAVPFMNATSTYHAYGDSKCESVLV